MKVVNTTLFELFKIGPGPSSSHTIGPMLAGQNFLGLCRGLPAETRARAERLAVSLHGSLAATGRGHGTHRAIVAGLLGLHPETVTPEDLDGLDRKTREIDLTVARPRIGPENIVSGHSIAASPYANTMEFRLLDDQGGVLAEREYYSVGGGFVQWKGQPEESRPEPPHPYSDMRGLRRCIEESGRRLPELILENETALTGATREEVLERLGRMAAVMEDAVDRGLAAEGVLPGPLELARKAPILMRRIRRSATVQHSTDRFLTLLNACAMAAAEENAAGHRVVTAPTSGAAGVVPSIVCIMKRQMRIPERDVLRGLLAAAAVGFLARHNASIAGADVGCQGEIGVASAMAAALLAAGTGHRVDVIENAAEIALEHHLGLTCDPVGGYVQIPCIERNAMGAVKAYNAFLLATVGDPAKQKVDLDKAIRVMAETGRDMLAKYRETSTGGLAACVEC